VIGALLACELASSAVAHPVTALPLSISTLIGTIARIMLHVRSARYSGTFWRDLPLVPLRAPQWVSALFGSHVVWRGARLSVVNRMTRRRTSIMEISDGR